MNKLIFRTLDTRIAPLAYLFVIQGLVWGLSFSLLSDDLAGVRNTILYKQSALVGVSLWGWLVLIASAILLGGMASKAVGATCAGAAGMWLAWVFAIIIYAGGQYWFLGTLALLNILMYGYIYLSASLGLLWDT